MATNVTKAIQNFDIQRGAYWGWYFAQPIDDLLGPRLWTDYSNLSLDLKNELGEVVAQFRLGDGLRISDDRTALHWYWYADTKVLNKGRYFWDLKVDSGGGIVEYPVGGTVNIIDNVTV